MEKADITVVGAGIIGLAISAAVTKENRAVYVLEKNMSFGQETSSRNSEVIHAGIYYPQGSLKAKTCVAGNRKIYEICQRNGIAFKRLGKLIVASKASELKRLEQLLARGQKNGVLGLEIIDQGRIKSLEPYIKAEAAIYSPHTGIVDSHALMQFFFHRAKSQGAEFVFQTEVKRITRQKGGYEVEVRDADGENFSFFSRLLINCAGFNSDLIAELAGIDIQKARYNLKLCKGAYFRVGPEKSRLVKHLIYPEPDQEEISLGIHATPDLGEGLRLGPDAQYIPRETMDYNIDNFKKEDFCQAVKDFLPFIEIGDLTADTAGIRAKLQGSEDHFRDFVIADETKLGFPGLIDLIGIDSPGLTASPEIARSVQQIVERLI
jgi:L-2-hydroxyglutarate oxidase LhgO